MENKAKKTRRYQRIEQVMDMAESIMEVDGYHAPILFAIDDGCSVIPCLIESTGNNMAKGMRKILKLRKSTACLFISEAWTSDMDDPEILKMVNEGKRIRDLDTRKEALSMSWEVQLEDEVVYGNRIIPFTKDKNDKVIFDKSAKINFSGNCKGRLVGLLP